VLLRFKILVLSFIHKRKYKVYESIDFLPIWNEKQIEKTKDARYLVRDINYDNLPVIHLNLLPIWDKIYSSFVEETNPGIVDEIKNVYVQFQTERNKYQFVNGAVSILANKDFINVEIINDLIAGIRMLGYRFDDSSEESYYNSLIDLKEHQLVGLARMIKFREDDYKQEELRKAQDKKLKSMDMEDTLVLFTKAFPGTIFNSKILTCKQYSAYLKRYNQIVTDMQVKRTV
jgi:hypothetical protein